MLRLGASLLVSSALLVVLAACGSGDASSDTDGGPTPIGDTGAGDVGSTDAGADGGTDLLPCTDNLDCRGGEVCRDGFCREACREGDVCSVDGQICDPELGYCIDPECADDGDCAGGFVCDTGACVPIDPVVCDAGTSRCDGSDLIECNRDGTRETTTTCGEGTLCIDDGEGDAECAAVVCAPNEVGCLDEQTAYVCNGSGVEQLELPCDAGDYCIEGVCLPRVCEPDTVVCEGNALVTCDETGGSRQVTPCAELELCAGSAAGCVCASGECTPRVCRPGTARCVGNARQACAADGLSFEAPAACGGDEVCVAGACVDQSCTPGSVECAGDNLATCAPDGTDRELVDCSATGQICVTEGAVAACGDPACTPDSSRCAPEGESVIVCDARGSAETTVPCGPDSFCADGACSPSVCDAGDPPVCFGGDVWQCDDRGAGFDLVETCVDGALCVSGACLDVVCTPGAVACDGEVLTRCSADGTVLTTDDCGARDAWCDEPAGVCRPRVCDPSTPPRCDGGDVYGCNDRGSAEELLFDCGGSGCTAGACLAICGDGVVDGGEECDDGTANGPTAPCSSTCRINDVVLCDGFGDEYCVELDFGTDPIDVGVPFSFDEDSIDVVLSMDITGSMSAEIGELQTEFSSQIVPTLRATFPRAAFAVTRWADVPCGTFGSSGDIPFELVQRVTTRTTDVQSAIDTLAASGGGDGPESGWEALFQLASGNGRVEPACSAANVPSFNAATDFIAGVADGVDGGVGFRSATRRVVIHVTDAESHTKSTEYPYGARQSEAIAALERVGARVVTIDTTTTSTTNTYLRDVATETGARVPPCAWDTVGRPASCRAGQCCTGDNGAGQATDAFGLCPLSYLSGADPSELDEQVSDSLALLAGFATWDVTIIARPDGDELDATGVDTSCFVRDVRAVSASSSGDACIGDPVIFDVRDPGATDGFANVVGGAALEFDIELDNSCAPATSEVQAFTVYLDVVSLGGYRLATQPVRVIVPPLRGCTDCAGECGDGVVDTGEECDDGNTADGDACTPECTLPRCGDGYTSLLGGGFETYTSPTVSAPGGATGRVCDDGATCPGRTCNVRTDHVAVEHAICQALGHERAVEASWGGGAGSTDVQMPHAINWSCYGFDCDNGPDLYDSDDCGTHEMLNQIVCEAVGYEACDDGADNAFAPDACRPDCSLPRCGDGVRDTGEACDDGNADPRDACTDTCTARRCGDGIVAYTEECDDGNRVSGDGCSSACVREFSGLPCADVDLGSELGVGVYIGSTVGRTDTYTPVTTCLSSGSNSPDVSLGWTAPATGTYRFTTEGQETDTVLSILSGAAGTCTGATLACDDDTDLVGCGDVFNPCRWSQVEIDLTAGQVVLVVIDVYGTGVTGPVQLNIEAVP